MTAPDESATVSEQGQRLLLTRGEVRAVGAPEDFYRRVQAVLGTFLQVKNLSLLLGAGCSYSLGSPRIRHMTRDEIDKLVADEASELPEVANRLISNYVESAGGRADMEELLSLLTAMIGVTRRTRRSLDLGDDPINEEELLLTRRVINRSLARACDLPVTALIRDDARRGDPLIYHRMFFQTLLRARRLGLPRMRVFTPNYDQVIEKALDSCGISYFDGFVGKVQRRFQPESFNQDLYLPAETDDRRLLRVDDVLYLYKIHGSVSWRLSASGSAPPDVVDAPTASKFEADESALIFPTPQKEMDSLGYPYSALFRSFSDALRSEDSALLVIGYGFADDHINRLIYQALGSPSFQLFVVVPDGVVEGPIPSSPAGSPGPAVKYDPGVLGSLAQAKDARIHVLTGQDAGTFEDLALNGLPDTPDIRTGELARATQDFVSDAFFKRPSDQ